MTPSPDLSAAVHALYRFRDDSGALLYVGITNNPGRRWTEHQKSKPWWHQVHRDRLARWTVRHPNGGRTDPNGEDE